MQDLIMDYMVMQTNNLWLNYKEKEVRSKYLSAEVKKINKILTI